MPAALLAALASPLGASDGNDASQGLEAFFWVVFAAAFVVVTFLGLSLLRRWLQRRRASGATPDQQRKWRTDFIAALIERAGSDTRRSVSLSSICGRLGWSRGHADLITGYLTAKGLVEKTAWLKGAGEPFETIGAFFGGERVRLTAAGLDETDRAQGGPTEHLSKITAIHSIVVAGSDQRVSAALDSPASAQTIYENGVDSADITRWIGDYWEALADAAVLSVAARSQAEHLLIRLEEANREGDWERVAKLGGVLREIAAGVAGNAAYGALVLAARSLFG